MCVYIYIYIYTHTHTHSATPVCATPIRLPPDSVLTALCCASPEWPARMVAEHNQQSNNYKHVAYYMYVYTCCRNAYLIISYSTC